MFAQIIRATTSNADALTALLDRWLTELAPGATGWLGSTSGVTDAGQTFACVRFDSEGSARHNSARPEQDRWWSEFSALLDGEVTFQDSNNIVSDETGDLDTAGFVQVIIGQSADLDRSRELMTEHSDDRSIGRPDILGMVSVGHEDGKYTHIVYFTSESEARAGEQQQPPPDVMATMEAIGALELGTPQYLDLREPWLSSPR